MKKDIVQLRRVSTESAGAILDSIIGRRNLSDTDLIELAGVLVDKIGKEGESIRITVEYPRLPPNMIAMMVPSTYVHINVSRATLTAIGFILDALVTYGVVSLGLGAVGLLKTSIARLDPKTGEFCSRIQAEALNNRGLKITPAAAAALVSKKPCPFSQLNCRLMKNTMCTASAKEFDRLFRILEEKSVLIRSSDEWALPL